MGSVENRNAKARQVSSWSGRRTIATAILAATLLLVGLASAGTKPGGGVPDWAVAVFPSGAEFTLEIAATDQERTRGYMFREKVGPRDGMLFLFEDVGTHSIWMKNCKVALDLIWLDADFTVVHIVNDRQPCPPDGDCPAVAPMRLSRYVLEIAGGMAAQQQLNVGDRLVILSEPAIR